MSFTFEGDIPTIRTASEDLHRNETGTGFLDFIGQNWEGKIVHTGFPSLDDAIGGGLYPRLYVLGGETSTGKTTFALNLADNIAKSGRSVCFFCMEMTRNEMIARSLSRLTHETNPDSALTENEILYHHAAIEQIPKKREAFQTALAKYQTGIGKKIYFFEGRRNLSFVDGHPETYTSVRNVLTEVIGREKEEAMKEGREYYSPVICLDYLQILRPEPNTETKTEKEQIDAHLEKIMTIKSALETPVIVVSSYNRASYYKDSGNNGSFKGSGEIEYSADGLFFLELIKEPDNADKDRWITLPNGKRVKLDKDPSEAFNKAMQENVRKIRLKATKNRGSKYGAEAYFEYFPAYNRFVFALPPTKAEGDSSYNQTAKNETQKNRARNVF